MFWLCHSWTFYWHSLDSLFSLRDSTDSSMNKCGPCSVPLQPNEQCLDFFWTHKPSQAHDVPLQSLQNPKLDPEYERAKASVT